MKVRYGKKRVKKSKLRFFFFTLGKLFLDAAKLSFGSLVLGSIIKGDISQSTLLISGIIASGVGAVLGTILVTFCREE
jgi:hypothetical protein